MQNLVGLKSYKAQKQPEIAKRVIVEKQLLQMYQTRMRSLMELVKIYQQNIQTDNQTGALAFMKTEQMSSYRIDRQFQLLKDALLIQKQKLVIKVLTACHELKKQNEILKKQNDLSAKQGNQRAAFLRNSQENIAEKDVHSRKLVERQSHLIGNKIFQRTNPGISRISTLSNTGQSNSSANVSIYEKLLQDKLALIKQLQKKNKNLSEQNEQHLRKINIITDQLQKSLTIKSQQCEMCKQFREVNSRLSNEIQLIKTESQKNKIKIKQDQSQRQLREEQYKLKQLSVKQLQLKLQALTQQLRLKQQQLIQTQQSQQQIQNASKPSRQNNLETIKQLKDQVIKLEQQLMTISNSFQLVKQDIGESLRCEVNKLKKSHLDMRQSLKIWINNIKKQALQSLTDIIEVVRLRSQNKNKEQDIIKRLRKLDNEIDFFIEQKHIRA